MCWQVPPAENDWAFAPLQAAYALAKRERRQAPDPTAPGPFAFADKDRVAGILTEAGWQNCSIEPFETEITLPGNDVESSARFMLQLGPLSRLIAEQDLDPQTILNAVIDKLSRHAETDGRIKMKSACWLVQASA